MAQRPLPGGEGHGDGFFMDVQTDVEDGWSRFHGYLFPFLFNEQFFGTSQQVDRSRIRGATRATSQTDARQFVHKP